MRLRAMAVMFVVALALTGALWASMAQAVPASNLVDSGPIDVNSRRIAAGTKAWARCICNGQNTATLNFIFGLHEYEG